MTEITLLTFIGSVCFVHGLVCVLALHKCIVLGEEKKKEGLKKETITF